MASEVDICNRALAKPGADPIMLLTDPSKPAKLLNGMFGIVRDAELRANRWSFAMKRTSLTALVDPPAWGYAYQYPLPPDFIGLVQVNDVYIRPGTKETLPWQLEGGLILTNLPAPLKMRYVSQVTNSGLFDALFVEALACKLAFESCETLTQSGQKLEAIGNQYKFAISRAAQVNAIENPPDELPLGSWLETRTSGGTVVSVAGTVNNLGTGTVIL